MQRTIGLPWFVAAGFAVLAAVECGTHGADRASAADAAPEAANDAASDAAPLDGSLDATGATGSACPDLPAPTFVPSSTAPLVIEGDPGSPLGVYDPSLIYAMGASGGVLAYSTVAPNSVRTRVAVTTDLGATFHYAADANDIVSPTTVTTTDPGFCDAGSCQVQGVLWHEVPSIIADPGDPAAPYKLFVHSYVSANGGATLRRDWGYIGMQTATSPMSWGPETKLLGWTSNATISTTGVTQVLSGIPELADCVAFTEPGAFVSSLGIDLALSCASSPSPGVVNVRVVLLRSTDHAASFSYVSELVAAQDFACLDGGAPQVLGADLFAAGSTEYVIVSPTGPVSNTDAGGYLGCVTIPLVDAAAGLISRGSSGAPAAVSFVRAADGRFTGPCTYAQGATAIGQLVPMQFSPTDLPLFRIMPTPVPEP